MKWPTSNAVVGWQRHRPPNRYPNRLQQLRLPILCSHLNFISRCSSPASIFRRPSWQELRMNVPLFLLLLLITACIILITVCNNNNLFRDDGKRPARRKLEETNRGVELFRHLPFTWRCGWREWTAYSGPQSNVWQFAAKQEDGEGQKMHRHLSFRAKVSVSVMSKWIVKLL